jgi:hypothetical protein
MATAVPWMTFLYSVLQVLRRGDLTDTSHCTTSLAWSAGHSRRCSDLDCHCEPEMWPVPPWAEPQTGSLLV